MGRKIRRRSTFRRQSGSGKKCPPRRVPRFLGDLGITTSSRWIKCISTPGNIRGVAIQATELVREAAKIHGVGETGARGLGEALIGALLIGSYCKPGERINLNIQGSGYF